MSRTSDEQESHRFRPGASVTTTLAALLCVVLGTILASATLDFDETPAHDPPPVHQNMDAAGANQPVTAVLLNFRGYDTWLEVGVLVVVVMSLLALHRTHGLQSPATERTDPVLAPISRLLLPFMLLVSGYLLWAGTHAPGGAFQAGAVLGAAGVLVRVAGTAEWMNRLMHGIPLHVLSLIGFMGFIVVAAGTVLAGRSFLELPSHLAGTVIFVLEAAVTISIGWTLAFLYMGATPRQAETGNSPR